VTDGLAGPGSAGAESERLGGGEVLTGDGALEGFSLPVARLFEE